jgi:soluble lytic murein transglycosylase
MKYWRLLSAVFMINLAILACSFPVSKETPVQVKFQETPTEFTPPTITSTPSPTPVPTPVPKVRIGNADRAFKNGDWETAMSEFQSVLESAFNPENNSEIRAAALIGIGRSQYKMGLYPEALEAFYIMVESYPDSTQLGAAYFAIAETLIELSQYQEAAQSYQKYLELQPGVIDSYIQERRGDANYWNGNYLDAIEAYQSAYSAPRVESSYPVEIKIANSYAAIGDYNTALVAYQDVYSHTTNDYTKAYVDLLMGQSYEALNQFEDAYSVYLDAVENYPLAHESYLALIKLVEYGFPVSEFDRGLVDYFAEQYNLSIAAFDRFLQNTNENAGTAYYYKGLAYLALDDPEAAIASWDVLIHSYLEDDRWADGWEEIAYTQWAYLGQYSEAIQTLLDFVDGYPWHDRAAEFLFDAARIAERSGNFTLAASIWERIPPEYPSSGLVQRALFLAGIAHYREGKYSPALSTFEWFLNSSVEHSDKSAAYFWMAKCSQVLGNDASSQTFLINAANEDPTGYYSERARDLLTGREPFESPVMYDLAFDAHAEKQMAEAWMRTVFGIPDTVVLSVPGPLLNDPRFIRGAELWKLGLEELARLEFESLRKDIQEDPEDNYRLSNYLLDIGLYRSSIFAARQVLNLNGMDDAQTMTAPIYFNHVRFGSYYRDLILPAAEAFEFHPLLIFSVVRQESLFEGFVRSSAGARGLMQIIPSTGESIATNTGWPLDYTAEDLYRPIVSINLGINYLDKQRDFFDGDLYAALAAYNAGPGNAKVWKDLSGGDQDLFLEIIRFEETRSYIKGIYEVFSIYRRLYDRSP